MYGLTQFPAVVVAGKPHSLPVNTTGEALGIAATSGTASIGCMLSEQMEITNHTPEGLIQILHLRTVTTRRAFGHSKRWFGR
jgi:hypothetical protein